MMKNTIMQLGVFVLYTQTILAQTQITDADLVNAYSSVSYRRETCHDPSIVLDTISNKSHPRYYIYGSHLGRSYSYPSESFHTWHHWNGTGENNDANNGLFKNASGETVNYSDAYNANAVSKVMSYLDAETDFGPFNIHDWQSSGYTIQGNQWAPDVIYNTTMKKWCIYMSINGDSWCSAIVLLTSDSPKGPWVYQGPVVFSGFNGKTAHVGYGALNDYTNTDYSLAMYGTVSSRYLVDASTYSNAWPNAIDPCVFYDQSETGEPQLLMSYGSWFGGIFILPLDPATGLRKYTEIIPYRASGNEAVYDPYFGYKIAGGYGTSGEGSYIQHVGNYYYLFITNGGLTASGGYQMRVFRSKLAKGSSSGLPFLDPWGIDARPGKYLLNYGANATRDYGLKLFGNYQWDLMPSAELAQGHCSVTVSPEGHTLLVNHVRFNQDTEAHEMRIHQLFLTKDGWLVASPYEYDNDTAVTDEYIKSNALSNSDICGDYQLMLHPFLQNTANKEYSTPVNITLNEDGSISGEYTGTWSCPSGTQYIDITLNNILGTTVSSTFHGVIVKQTIDYSNIPAIVFTAAGTQPNETTQRFNLGYYTFNSSSSYFRTPDPITTSGMCIWGSKAETKAAIKYTLDKVAVPFSNGSIITAASQLPTTGKLGANISWSSSNESIMAPDGTLMGNGYVTMTMHILKDGSEYARSYNLTVSGVTAIDEVQGGKAKVQGDILYNIAGQRVNSNAKGILVRDGVKFNKLR